MQKILIQQKDVLLICRKFILYILNSLKILQNQIKTPKKDISQKINKKNNIIIENTNKF